MDRLGVYVGVEAARKIEQEGWSPDLFDLLLGASGGAKWLILGHLDRLLFGRFLQGGTRPLSVIGSSIGSWRHTCLALPDPCAAIDRFEQGYLQQHYTSKPSAEEISEVSRGILDRMLGGDGAAAVLAHPRIRTHIVTARGRGPASSSSSALLAASLGAAALGNMVSRRWLPRQFQRVVFHSDAQPRPQLSLHDFGTVYCLLREDTLKAALHASGSIPFVLTGERDIPGAPGGRYWDGGIIDYHFDLRQYHGDGLVLYPHFSNRVVPGWFDKFLPWRTSSLQEFDKLVLLCPTRRFVDSLPLGKIPDRSDFAKLGHEERVRYWETCIERSGELAEDFAQLLDSPDPLAEAVVMNRFN